MSYQGVWRDPAEETVDLYPGLVVCDNRHSGSITLGRSRLPVQSLIPDLLAGDSWAVVAENFDAARVSSWTAQDLTTFLCALLDVRGEFARLLLMLAAAEVADWESETPWWRDERRGAIADQLRRCLATLETEEASA